MNKKGIMTSLKEHNCLLVLDCERGRLIKKLKKYLKESL